MPGLVIDGVAHDIPGLIVRSWLDDKRLTRSPRDGKPRSTKWVRMIINHTTKGIPGGKNHTPQHLIPGAGPAGKEFDVAEFWFNDPQASGAHCVVGRDGAVGQLADLFRTLMWHAMGASPYSIGNELYQEANAGIYEAVLDAAVILIEWQCRLLGIQRQIHLPYRNAPLKRLSTTPRAMTGVFGHRDQTSRRGPGDPGHLLMERLEAAGFEVFDFSKNEDRKVWAGRQAMLGVDDDGLPGPQTNHALRERGYPYGLWTLGEVTEPEPEIPDFIGILCRSLGCYTPERIEAAAEAEAEAVTPAESIEPPKPYGLKFLTPAAPVAAEPYTLAPATTLSPTVDEPEPEPEVAAAEPDVCSKCYGVYCDGTCDEEEPEVAAARMAAEE